MFTVEERALLRSQLLDYAANDQRISGGAVTGSGAAANEDQWSDIDLAFGVRDGAELPKILSDWTEYMYEQHRVLHHMDLRAGAWIYRVFLLPSTLQVDLAFVPAEEFQALAPTFRLVFGQAKEPRSLPPPSTTDIIAFGWLYALHARSSIARRKLWQAEYMISAMRDNALALACIRHGLPAVYGRGIDLLPNEAAAKFEESLIRQLDTAELSRAFRLVTHGLLSEIRNIDEQLAERLGEVLIRLSDCPEW